MPKIVKVSSEKSNMVKALSMYGVPQEDIAALLGMCVETMQKHYPKELAEGKASANAKIGKRLFEKAMDGDTSSLIFWAKARMRWRTVDALEVSGPDGGPIQVNQLPPAQAMLSLIRMAGGDEEKEGE